MPEESLLRRLKRAEFDCNPKAFMRAASQRLDAANLLLRSRLFLDAVYLAGYVAECALKALILSRTPAAERRAVCRELTSGARAHNFDVLSRILRSKGCSPPPDIRGFIDLIDEEWRTDLRYAAALIPEREAERFLGRVGAVYEWVRRSL
jgi:HEPN domain-containing protein